MPKRIKDEPLSERASLLLKCLVDQYVDGGTPVGSRTLSKQLDGQISSATIRNVMADLEEQGYISSPHTSAGRIPTVKGYRFFVDALLNIKPLNTALLSQMTEQLHAGSSNESLIQSASNILSGFTQMAGIVTIPKDEKIILRHLEFLPLNENRVLVIMVVNDSEVQNRVIQLPSKIEPSVLERAANFFNAHYSGKSLSNLRGELLSEMRKAKHTVDDVMASALAMAEQVFTDAGDAKEGDFVLRGETNLMGYDELSDVAELRKLFEVFQQKRDMLFILDQCISADGVQIFIGEESGYDEFSQCSLVTAPYTSGDKTVGVLGVIGPTRMKYGNVVSMVDVTAKLLSAALNSK